MQVVVDTLGSGGERLAETDGGENDTGVQSQTVEGNLEKRGSVKALEGTGETYIEREPRI